MLKVSAALDLSLKNLVAYNNLRFTPRQLYYEFCRAAKQPKGLELKAAAVIGAAGLPVSLALLQRKPALAAGLFAASAVATGSLVFLRRSAHILVPPFSFRSFENALDDYLQQRERPFGLLDKKTNAGNDSPNSPPSDLPLYGLPRLLICESAEIAQMLLVNNFHLEASCAILSFDEAQPLDEIFQKMLLRAVTPHVYYLHDASFAAYAMIPNLRERLALPESVRLQILGLRPAHAERLHLFAEQGKSLKRETLEMSAFLAESEKCWLATGKRAEVAAVHPVRLLRVLRRLILGLPAAPQSSWKNIVPRRELGFMS